MQEGITLKEITVGYFAFFHIIPSEQMGFD